MTVALGTKFAHIKDIQEMDIKGPWTTKSGGELSALFNVPLGVLHSSFFRYDTAELALVPEDIRGLRAYHVKGIAPGTIGANEWHKLRHELVFALNGTVRWTCEDIYGQKKVSTLDAHTGIWVKPGILHSYESLSPNACLLVIANTLFKPDNPETHDTYSADAFRELQATFAAQEK